MKTLRFLLMGVFVFCTAFTLAKATPQHTVGFILLLERFDSDVPMEVQTHEAMQRLMRQLLAAKRDRQIKDFEPSWSTGVLRILFEGDTRVAEFAGRQVYARMEDAMEDAVVAFPDSSPVYDEADSPLFNIYPYDNCFESYYLGSGTRVVGKLLKDTQLMAVSDGYADGDGHLGDCFGPGFYTKMLPGYKLVFKLYDGSTNALLGSYTVRIPNIKFKSIGRAKATVSGTGPANKPFDLYWYHRNLNAGDTSINNGLSGTISSTGAWTIDFANPPAIRGNDVLTIDVYFNLQFTFHTYMYAPAIYCQLGSNHCEIYGFAGTPATFSIVRGSTTYNFKGKFDEWGVFRVEWEDASGAPIFTKAGDRVSGTGVPSYKLPSVTASVDFFANVVSGRAPATSYFRLWVLTHEPYHWYYVYSHADSLGYYSTDFTTQVDLDPARPITVEIYYRDKATGNDLIYDKAFME